MIILGLPNPKRPMKKGTFHAAACLLLLLCSCRKEKLPERLSTPGFKEFIIPQGQHYATENNTKTVETSELKFVVRFDSSAIYQTKNPENQYDINKLYGFSDNDDQHHVYSARFGWRWSDGALRLFAYTYNNKVRESKELGVAPIGADIACSIKVQGNAYFFSVNDKKITMPRSSSTAAAKGYQLYPYFGGDEPAPHEVRILIKEEN